MPAMADDTTFCGEIFDPGEDKNLIKFQFRLKSHLQCSADRPEAPSFLAVCKKLGASHPDNLMLGRRTTTA
jgi:hypothetical protein